MGLYLNVDFGSTVYLTHEALPSAVVITAVDAGMDGIRLRFDAPLEVTIDRASVHWAKQEAKRDAANQHDAEPPVRASDVYRKEGTR